MGSAKAVARDFTNVKEGGGQFNRAHRVPGDYKAVIASVEQVDNKKSGGKQWLWTIKQGSGSYPYYTQFTENTLWKIRNLFAAAGVAIPKKRVKLDPNKVVGKNIGISLDDHEYDDKMFSEIISVFPVSELVDADEDDEADDEDEDEDEEDEDEDEAEEEASDDDDEDEDNEDEDDEEEDEDDEEEEEPEPEPVKKKAKKGKAKATKKAAKTKRKSTDDVDDDELEELDIEEI
jgi:hypothetical protein